jgi:hypothetical protein
VCQGQFAAGEGQATGMTAAREHEPGRPDAPLADLQKIGPHEARGPLQQLGAGALEMTRQLLLLVDLVDDAADARQEGREIHLGRVSHQPVAGGLPGVAKEPRGMGHGPRRDAAVIGADAAQPITLGEGDRGTQLACAQSGRDTGRAAADHHQVEQPLLLAGHSTAPGDRAQQRMLDARRRDTLGGWSPTCEFPRSAAR